MSTLEVCLGITGQFEGGHGGPRYDLVSGNFDDMGMSVGCLQWNPGTGSLQKLLKLIFQKLGGVPEGCEDIDALVRIGCLREFDGILNLPIIDPHQARRLSGPARQHGGHEVVERHV